MLVVGGAGFIGSHLVERMLSEGHEVDVVDDLSRGSLANLAIARALGGSLKIHHLDASSPDADTLIGMRRPETVVVLADVPGREAADRLRTLEIVLTIVEAARRHGVAKVVVAIPATALYGHPSARSLPVKEGDLGATAPRGVRGVMARAIVELLQSYRDLHAIEFTALAMATVYGPRQRHGVVAEFEAAARANTPPRIDGDGRQTRDLLFVDDAVDALMRATERGGGLVVNVGTGAQTPVNELWELVASAFGVTGLQPSHGPARFDELVRFAVSPVRARIHLSWSPWTDLADGIAQLPGG